LLPIHLLNCSSALLLCRPFFNGLLGHLLSDLCSDSDNTETLALTVKELSLAENKNQIVRLAYIHEQLRKGGHPNASQLARGFSVKYNLRNDVSEKTIYRDIKFLRERRGAPIEFDPDNNGYRYSQPNYKLETVSLSEGELFAFYVAETAMRAYAGTPLADYLSKAFARMADMLPEKTTVWTRDLAARISFRKQEIRSTEKKIWERLEHGLREEYSIQIDYHSVGRKKSQQRLIDPYHLCSWQGDWYVVALCHLRKEMRTFKVSRIVAATITRKEFLIPDNFSIDEYLKDSFGVGRSQTRFNVKIRFKSRIAPWIREKLWHPKQKLKEEKNGDLILEFPGSFLDEVFSWVMSWGAAAKVLEPRQLRKRVRDEARAMAK
jgi:predicted DNA-binding transcriptional regulator YafY